MMRNDDPDVGQFNALLADLAELRAGRRFAKAMAMRPTRREFVPHSYFAKPPFAPSPALVLELRKVAAAHGLL
jgi:hypothetical protein